MYSQEELHDVILQRVASSGHLGESVQFVSCITDGTPTRNSSFASSVCFLTAEFQSTQETFKEDIVIKCNISDEAARKWLKLDEQFRNEVIVYEKVLPFLGKEKIDELFPKFFYGSADEDGNPVDFIIVLEDLRRTGFRLTDNVLDLDFAHCALAFKKLGIFHALSFAAKQSRTEEFFQTVSTMVETKLYEDVREDRDFLYVTTVDRAAEPLLTRKEKVDEIERFKKKIADSFKYMENILSVQEPMGVVCHGDFCRNNVLFKYQKGMPVDMKFFDLATARYGSPMLDFSFFFFMNCSEEARELYREEYLTIYHDSLTSAIPGVEVPSLEDFRAEFRKKAVYGFLICSYFKPSMMAPKDASFVPEVEAHKPSEEKALRRKFIGAEKATKVISNMLREIIDLNCDM